MRYIYILGGFIMKSTFWYIMSLVLVAVSLFCVTCGAIVENGVGTWNTFGILGFITAFGCYYMGNNKR
jgi:hypothetical protein